MSSDPKHVSYFKKAREWAYPVRTESAFLQRGVLTPEEFVRAGDELVFKCPTWSWESSTSDDKRKSYLPPDKQYLMTRNVPCPNRVSVLEQGQQMTSLHLDEGNDDDDDEWLVSNITTNIQETNLEDDFDILDEQGDVVVMEKPQQQEEEEEEYVDMDDFEDDNVLQDDVAAVAVSQDDENNNLVKVRTYDLSITYDKYYQTPRLWMMGYTDDATRQPLTGIQMMEDVMSDYANRTVTIESHPHITGPHASIHPCQHAKVMKTIVKNLMKEGSDDDGDKPSVEMYLFIFLKFVSSIIPTINYDFTMEVTASTKK